MNIFILESELLKLTLSDYGASWLSCIVKMPSENREVLVTTTPEYWQKQTCYFGATIGRTANRIAKGHYTLNGRTYTLAQNNGENNLHGGEVGADKIVWQVCEQKPNQITFSYTFSDGEEGFGGEVEAKVTYCLNGDCVEISYDAKSTQDTPLCLTNHAYFNLNGYGDIRKHILQINAERYLPVASDGIPNAPLTSVEQTGFDFRQAKTIGQDLLRDEGQKLVKGYDHTFELTPNAQIAAQLSVPDLTLTMQTNYPALQVYTGNWLAGEPDKNGSEYEDYAGVALEAGFYPNAVNVPELQKIGGITRAGELYQHSISYQFNVK